MTPTETLGPASITKLPVAGTPSATPAPSYASGVDLLVDLLTDLWASEALNGESSLTEDPRLAQDAGEVGTTGGGNLTVVPNPQVERHARALRIVTDPDPAPEERAP